MARKNKYPSGVVFCSNLWKAHFFLRFPFLDKTCSNKKMVQDDIFYISNFDYHFSDMSANCQIFATWKVHHPNLVAESRGGTRAVHKASSGLNFQWRNPSECGPPSPPWTKKKHEKNCCWATKRLEYVQVKPGLDLYIYIYPISSGRWKIALHICINICLYIYICITISIYIPLLKMNKLRVNLKHGELCWSIPNLTNPRFKDFKGLRGYVLC